MDVDVWVRDSATADLAIIMAATNDLGVSARPEAITQDVLGLHDTCHRTGVQTVFLSLPPNSGTNREVPRCHLYASRWEHLNMTLGQNCWSNSGDSLTAGFHMTGQRFSPNGEALSLGDLDVCMCGVHGLTAVQLSENEDARLIVDVACRRGQGLGSVLEESKPFDLLLIIAGTLSSSHVWSRLRGDGEPPTGSYLPSSPISEASHTCWVGLSRCPDAWGFNGCGSGNAEACSRSSKDHTPGERSCAPFSLSSSHWTRVESWAFWIISVRSSSSQLKELNFPHAAVGVEETQVIGSASPLRGS